MSYRAIQKLREERGEAIPSDDERESESEEEGDDPPSNRASAFAMMDDSSSDDDSSGSSDEGEDKDEDVYKLKKDDDNIEEDEDNEEKVEDLDSLLNEFKMQDDEVPKDNSQTEDTIASSWFDLITSKMDFRSLDFDSVMRTSLLGGITGEGSSSVGRGVSNRRGRQTFVFGPPKDAWPKAPRYVGGGIGMTTYDVTPRPLPWPYSDMKKGDERCPGEDRWYTFQFSDSYLRDCSDYERVQASGDANMLALFCAHHPFLVDALLQLSLVLYQTSQSQEGRLFLQRSLWVYECSFLNSFIKKTFGLMDYDQPENKSFFVSLFRMVRISHVAGLPRVAQAFGKLLLSLDPLRDPMNVLLVLDYFVLLSNTNEDDKWLVEFFESQKVSVFHRDREETNEYECGIESLPNWSWSYALALYRINQKDPSPEAEEKANNAMKDALSAFPSILENLLMKNEVNMSAQSFQSPLRYANDCSKSISEKVSEAVGENTLIQSRIIQSFESMVRIYVGANFKLWSSPHLHRFMLKNLEELVSANPTIIPLEPAIMRFSSSDPADFVDRFQTMPAEANPLDGGLVARAINVETNRPRFMQRVERGREEEFNFPGNQQGFAGPPMEVIDPDWPLLEVFWRSMQPWATVDGVPPPPR